MTRKGRKMTPGMTPRKEEDDEEAPGKRTPEKRQSLAPEMERMTPETMWMAPDGAGSEEERRGGGGEGRGGWGIDGDKNQRQLTNRRPCGGGTPTTGQPGHRKLPGVARESF